LKQITIFFFLLFFTKIYAQKSIQHFHFDNIENKLSYGFIAAHRESIRYLQRGHIPSFEIMISHKTFGEKEWEQLFRYPTYGFGYYYAYLNYPDVLGSSHAVFSFINIPLLELARYSINYNLAFGVSYITKAFDIDENYYNVAIGSHTNVYLNVGFDQKIRLSKNLKLLFGIGLSHYSNGSISKPNLGLNIISAQTGISYHFAKSENPKIFHPNIKNIASNHFQLIYSAGYKRIYPPGEKAFFVSSLEFDYERILFIKYRLGFGFDLFYNSSLYEKLLEQNTDNISKIHNFREGIHFSYSINFGQLNFYMQIGYYLFTKWKDDGNIYNKFGLNYYFPKNFFTHLGVKTHLSKADFIEYGIGYCF